MLMAFSLSALIGVTSEVPKAFLGLVDLVSESVLFSIPIRACIFVDAD